MRIALLGYGVVGKGIDELLQNHEQFEIRTILVRRQNACIDQRFTLNFEDILSDECIDTVIEVIGGLSPAREYIIQALNHGKNVITANKAVIAKYYDQFLKIAKQKQVKLLFEASVAGGIPWIKNLKLAKRLGKVNEINGIMNGTTNYILDSMKTYHIDFSLALAQAQKLGYAEADPTADLEGIDIRNKICISSAIAYDTLIPIEEIPMEGISNIIKTDIDFANEQNKTIKCMAYAHAYHQELSIYVEPTLLNNEELVAHVQQQYNMVSYHTDASGCMSFYGAGAGSHPTASAIIQDLYDLKTSQLPILTNKYSLNNQLKRHHYLIRTLSQFTPFFESITQSTQFIDNFAYITTFKMDVEQMHTIMKEFKEIDPSCFFAGIKENES